MTGGSPALWALAEACDVIPAPPDPALAGLLRGWWELPRTYGCQAAKTTGSWTIVAPHPEVWCPDCALVKFETLRVCCYCHQTIRRLSRSDALIFQMRQQVNVLARAHSHCAEEARHG